MNTAKIVLTDLPIDSTDATDTPDENVYADRQGSEAPPLAVMPVWMAFETLSQEFDEKSRDESRPMAETHMYSLRAMEMGICAELLKSRTEGSDSDPRIDDPIAEKATAMDLERGYSILSRRHPTEEGRQFFNDMIDAKLFQGWQPGCPTGDVKRAILIWNVLLSRIVQWLENQGRRLSRPTTVMQVAAMLRSRLLFETGVLIREMVG